MRNLYLNLKYGIKNIFIFGKVIWRFRPWDYSYILSLIEVSAKYSGESIKKYGITTTTDEVSSELLELSNLAKRIAADDYLEEAGYKQGLNNIELGFVSMKAQELENKDINRFSELWLKVHHWWD